MTNKNTSPGAQVPGRGLIRPALLAAAASAIGNVIIYALAAGPFDIALMILPGPGATELVPLSVWQVVVVSILPAVVAPVLLALLSRFVEQPMRVFQLLAIVVLLLSFVPVLTLPGVASNKVVLGLMHVVSAVAIVGILTTQP